MISLHSRPNRFFRFNPIYLLCICQWFRYEKDKNIVINIVMSAFPRKMNTVFFPKHTFQREWPQILLPFPDIRMFRISLQPPIPPRRMPEFRLTGERLLC